MRPRLSEPMLPKVLLVDDQPENLFALSTTLGSLDAEVTTATSGEEALSMMLKDRYAVVLLDVQMPVMDGFETAQLIHANSMTRDTPIIFVTAISKESRYQARGYASGAVDYLLKPIDSQVLLSKVEVFLRLERQRGHVELTLAEVKRLSRRNDLILKCAEEGVIGLDEQQIIVFANPAANRRFGVNDSIVGETLHRFTEQASTEEFSRLKESLRDRRHVHGIETTFSRHDGSSFPVECSVASVPASSSDETLSAVLVFQDITDRKVAEEKLRRLASYDHLTGIANRALFYHNLQAAMARTRRSGRPLAVLLLDLDHFKQINDTLGHDAGDTLLRTTAERLKRSVRAGDVASRLGGDEFALVLDDIIDEDNALKVARHILGRLSQSTLIEGHRLFPKCSIGVVVDHGLDEHETAESLIKKADNAMYVVKRRGRNDVAMFTADMLNDAEKSGWLKENLALAIQNDDLEVHFQPQYHADTRELVGLEALARWQHCERGPVSPQEFIPVAESSGLIVELGRAILDKALSTYSEWRKRGLIAPEVRLAVNVSAVELRNPMFATGLVSALRGVDVPAANLEVEVTETTFMPDQEVASSLLGEFARHGVRIAIDDFGVGYSSLAYLQQFPISTLKIDRTFVGAIGRQPSDDALVKAIISLAKDLELSIVAEGVEERVQADLLALHGCDILQGFWLSRPLGAHDLEQLLLPGEGAA